MKVVHLLPALEQGGVETVVCDLVKALGNNVGMWEYGNEGNAKNGEMGKWESVVLSKGGRLVARIEAAGGRHVALDLKSKNPLTYLSRVWRLRRILRAERPDLVCVHSRVPAWLYVGVRRIDPTIASIPWISYAHGANSVSRYSAVMTKGDLVVTPSRFLADFLKANYGTDESKIRVIPNAVDAVRFDPENLDRTFVDEKRRAWGIREDDHVTMAIGRITPVKGLDGLIREFAKSAAENTGRKLVIVGGADKHHAKYLASLKELAASLTLSPSHPNAAHLRRSCSICPQCNVRIWEYENEKMRKCEIEEMRERSPRRTCAFSHFPNIPIFSLPYSHNPTLHLANSTGFALKLAAFSSHPSIIFAGPQEKIPECISIADEIVSANVTKPESFGLSIVEAYAMNRPVRVARRFGGAAEVMDAVEKSGKPTLRDAVLDLYGFDRWADRTRRVYREATEA